MPLTETGKRVLADMRKRYGHKKGDQVFHAKMNKDHMEGDWEASRKKHPK